MSEPHFGLAPPSSLLFLPPSCCVSPLPPHTIHLGHCPRRSPCQIFCAGCILSLLPLAFSAPHSLSLLLSSCAICLLPHLLLPLSHCPQTPFRQNFPKGKQCLAGWALASARLPCAGISALTAAATVSSGSSSDSGGKRRQHHMCAVVCGWPCRVQ